MKIKPVCEFVFPGRRGQELTLALLSILNPEQGITLKLKDDDEIAFCVFSLEEAKEIHQFLCQMYPVSSDRRNKMNSNIADLVLSGEDKDSFSISYDNYGEPFSEGSRFEVEGSVNLSCFLDEVEARAFRDKLFGIIN